MSELGLWLQCAGTYNSVGCQLLKGQITEPVVVVIIKMVIIKKIPHTVRVFCLTGLGSFE